MIAFITLLSVVAVAGIAGSIALVATDGYGRTPKQTFVRSI